MKKVEILLKLLEGSYGRGWWYSIPKGKLIEMHPGEIGPHSDHDGWISVGDNARKLGVDPKKAMAFQQAVFGTTVNKKDTLYKYKKYADGYVDFKNINIPQKELDDYFKKNFGMTYKQALSVRFPELIRIRWWPRRVLSFVLAELNDKYFQHFMKALLELIKILNLKKGDKVVVSDFTTEHVYNMTLEKVLFAKSVRDFR